MKVLIIDDEPSLLRLLEISLKKAGYESTTASTAATGLQAFQSDVYDAVLCDIGLGSENGLEVLANIKAKQSELPVIMITAHGSVETAIKAMKLGAYDYVQKPFEPEEIHFVLERAIREHSLQSDLQRLRQHIEREFDFSNLIGRSPAMKALFTQIRKAAETNATVMISGESGTGKELIAKAIHFNSSRKTKAFVVVDCGSIPSNLLESELFGHAKGAFTGADQMKRGLCEEAHHGSLFLDEIGEMPLELQNKLLRLLQESTIRRIGDTKEIHLNLRVIAATNRNLEEEVQNKHFREDLFYRLNVISLEAPALRNRKEDIPLLSMHFLQKMCADHSKKIQGFRPECLKIFHEYHWPGNVRQLENVIEQAVVMSDGEWIEPEHLPKNLPQKISELDSIGAIDDDLNLKASLDRVQSLTEIKLIRKALEKTGFNKTKAAQLLGISRRSLIYKTQIYKIQESDS